MLAIGYGYLRRGEYRAWRRLWVGHYITLYGYDDEAEVFYLYDPWLEGDYPSDIPVGNEVRTYAQVLDAWRGPVYYDLIGMRWFYLAVSGIIP